MAIQLYAWITLCYVCLLTCTCVIFKLPFSLPLIPPHLLYTITRKTGWGWNYCLQPFCKQHRETCLLLSPFQHFTTNYHFCFLSFYSQPFSFLLHFSCRCLKIKMMFEVQHSGIKPKCISSMPTCCLINFPIILCYFQNLLLISVP